MGQYGLICVNIGIMEKKMETTIVGWGKKGLQTCASTLSWYGTLTVLCAVS